jgi:major type 1 subunit fimbrin (pilin)
MKISILPAALLLAGFTTFAHANSGVITFTGELVATSCVVTPGAGVGGGAGNINVNMGTVALSDLSQGNGSDFGAATQINLDVDCSSGAGGLSSVKMIFDPRSGSGVNPGDTRLLQLSPGAGAATGVGIAIINDNNKIINMNANETIDAPLVISGDTGKAELSMRAAYVLSGAPAQATVGVANATLPFTLKYE